MIENQTNFESLFKDDRYRLSSFLNIKENFRQYLTVNSNFSEEDWETISPLIFEKLQNSNDSKLRFWSFFDGLPFNDSLRILFPEYFYINRGILEKFPENKKFLKLSEYPMLLLLIIGNDLDYLSFETAVAILGRQI